MTILCTAIAANTARAVGSKKVAREAFKHKKEFIILEDVVIGVCAACGSRYYSADVLHAVNDSANGTKPFERIEKIPVAHLSPS